MRQTKELRKKTDWLNGDVSNNHKAGKKAKGLLKRLNIVGVLNKRIEHSEVDASKSKYDLLTLPRIEKTIPKTTFSNGVQVFETMPRPVAVNDNGPVARTALVIPQDHCVQYLDMNLRRRENNQKENCSREVTDEEVVVMDILERFRTGFADFGTLKCLNEKCEEINSFVSVFVLAYHISVKHNYRNSSDGFIYCFICGSNFQHYYDVIEHLRKTHEEFRKQHCESRALQALEKEQKKNRKIKNGNQSETKGQYSIYERSRSLSPCSEDNIDENSVNNVDLDTIEKSVSDQGRLHFLCSTSDQNLEKSDDDDMTLQSDEIEQSFETKDDQVVFDCIYHLIDLVCSRESTTLMENGDMSGCTEMNDGSNVSNSVHKNGDHKKLLDISDINHDKSQLLDGSVEKSGKAAVSEVRLYASCSNDKSLQRNTDQLLDKQSARNSHITQQDVKNAMEKMRCDVKNSEEAEHTYTDDSPEVDGKRIRKTRSDKGKKRKPRRRKIFETPVVLKDKKERHSLSKRPYSRLRRQPAESVTTNAYKEKRRLSSIVVTPGVPVPSEGLYSYRQRLLRRKILEKERMKITQEASKKKSQTFVGFKKTIQKPSSFKDAETSNESRSKRMRLDASSNGTLESGSNQKPVDQNSIDSSDTSKRRYRRFSHQCLPISSIDVVFVPRRKVPNSVPERIAHIKAPGPSNADTNSDALKKTGTFLRRSYLNQRKEDSALSSQSTIAKNASFMDPSSIPVYMTEAENKAIFSFVALDKSSSNKVYRCRHCNETFDSEMDSRKHAVGHLRIIRLRCSLCRCCSFFCSDMRTHLQMRHCEKLNRAPPGIVAPGKKVPCMTYNQADSLIEVAVKEKPGRVAFTSGKIISTASYKPYYPDATTEKKILENTTLKDMTETVP